MSILTALDMHKRTLAVMTTAQKDQALRDANVCRCGNPTNCFVCWVKGHLP